MKWLICVITGRHKFEEDFMEIDTSKTEFHRIDCTRCAYSIEGAMLKRLYEQFEENGARGMLVLFHLRALRP